MAWQKVRLGKLLNESKILSDQPDPNKRIRVKLNVGGVEKRPIENEIEGATKYYTRKAGQFIYGKQNFHKGAFGIIPTELDGFESSADIPSFDVDSICTPEWIYYFFKKGSYYKELEALARGVGSKRIHPEQIYDLQIPLPPLFEQYKIIRLFKEQETKLLQLRDEITHQEVLLKQLRETILREAVQGKLVPQNPADEPATELLNRIKVEKEALIKAGKLKKEKPLPSIQSEEIPFELPQGWTWCKLSEVIVFGPTNGFSPEPSKVETKVKCLTLTATTSGFFKPNFYKFIGENIAVESSLWLRPGDILIQRGNALEYVGITAIYNGANNEYIYPDLMMKIRCSSFMDTSYLHTVLNAPYNRLYFMSNASGAQKTMPKINQQIVVNTIIPLPPFSEQRRIVDKINSLFKSCNELEAQIRSNKAHTEMLMQAVLKEAFEEPAESIPFTAEYNEAEESFALAAEPDSEYTMTYGKRAVLAGTIIEYGLERNDPYLGHTKFQKMLYVCENFAQVEDIETAYGRHEYGAYDPDFLHDFHRMMEKEKWFKQVKRGKLRGYESQANCQQLTSQFDQLYADKKDTIRFVLGVFEPLTSDESELLATLYAVWNNLLIRQEEVTMPRLIQDFYQWSEGKKKFSQDKIIQFYEAMKHKGLVPCGYGKEIV